MAFATVDRLLPADGDQHGRDVYALIDGRRTVLLTPDEATPPGWQSDSTLRAMSRDGSRFVISTNNAYSPQDVEADHYPTDTYVLENGAWSLVTSGPDTPLDWGPVGYTEDLHHVYFETESGIAANDTDSDFDIYEWADGEIKMVSTGPNERTEPMPPWLGFETGFGGATQDGSQVFFTYGDELTAGADPSHSPLYVRGNGTTTEWIDLPGTIDGNWSPDSGIGGVSFDGSRIYVTTNLRIDPDDNDLTWDVYQRTADGRFTLLSIGASGGTSSGPECHGPPHANCGAGYAGASRSGHRVFFTTDERLLPEDTDSSYDIYERSGSTTTLVSPGTEDQPRPMSFVRAPQFEGVSADGTQVALTTWSQLAPADRDRRPDIYVRVNGSYHLISTGPEDRNSKFDPVFGDFVDNGGSVVFWTRQPLTAADTDDDPDVYERTDFNKAPGRSAMAAGKRKKGKARARGRTKLVSAERIPPRIRIGAGRVRGGKAQVRISCPKKEESGSCRGRVRAAGGGSGSFKLKSGRSGWVSVGAARGSALVVVKGRDALGNRAKARKRVSF